MLNKDLIKLAKQDNKEAVETLVRENLSLIYSISLRYLKNTEDAEDATQEIFVKVWRNLKKFDIEKDFQPWISAIAKNTCLDMLKRKRVIPFSAFDTESGNALVDTLVATELTPVQALEQSQLKIFANSAIEKLSPAYQSVLRMYYEAGLNFREIAESMNESVDTVKSRHRRAILQLKKFLSDDKI